MDPKLTEEWSRIIARREREKLPSGSGREFLNKLYEEQPEVLVRALQETLNDVYGDSPGKRASVTVTYDPQENPVHPYRMQVQLQADGKDRLANAKHDEQFFRKMKKAYAKSLGAHPCGALRPLEHTAHGSEFTLIHHNMALMAGVVSKLAANEQCLGPDARLMIDGQDPERFGSRADGHSR